MNDSEYKPEVIEMMTSSEIPNWAFGVFALSMIVVAITTIILSI